MNQVLFSKTGLSLLCISMLAISIPKTIYGQSLDIESQQRRPIFGFVVPGETTLKDFREAVTERRCKFKEDTSISEDKSILVIDPGCFDLPGDPTVMASGPMKSGAPMDALWVNYRKDELGSSYDAYLASLTKHYGDPVTLQSPPQGQREALWTLPGNPLIAIVLEESGQGGKSSLLYMFGDSAYSYLHERGIEPDPKSHKDLDSL